MVNSQLFPGDFSTMLQKPVRASATNLLVTMCSLYASLLTCSVRFKISVVFLVLSQLKKMSVVAEM